MIEIVSTEPPPRRPATSQKKLAEQTFARMQPGDSILIEPTDDIPKRPVNWASYVSDYARFQNSQGNPVKFTTQRKDGAIRIWRIE